MTEDRRQPDHSNEAREHESKARFDRAVGLARQIHAADPGLLNVKTSNDRPLSIDMGIGQPDSPVQLLARFRTVTARDENGEDQVVHEIVVGAGIGQITTEFEVIRVSPADGRVDYEQPGAYLAATMPYEEDVPEEDQLGVDLVRTMGNEAQEDSVTDLSIRHRLIQIVGALGDDRMWGVGLSMSDATDGKPTDATARLVERVVETFAVDRQEELTDEEESLFSVVTISDIDSTPKGVLVMAGQEFTDVNDIPCIAVKTWQMRPDKKPQYSVLVVPDFNSIPSDDTVRMAIAQEMDLQKRPIAGQHDEMEDHMREVMNLLQIKADAATPTQEKTETAETELTSEQERIRDLFNGSFFFSQGQADQQKRIMYWLIKNGYLNDIELPAETPDYIHNMEVPGRHQEVAPDRVNQLEMMYDVWSNMQYHVQNGSSMEELYYQDHDLVEELTGEMVSRDYLYQTRRPRPGRDDAEGDVVPDSSADVRASLLRRFVLQGESTGMDAFDRMCAEMREFLANDIALELDTTYTSLQEPRRTAIGALQAAWESNHPGEDFFAGYERPPQQVQEKTDVFTADDPEPPVIRRRTITERSKGSDNNDPGNGRSNGKTK